MSSFSALQTSLRGFLFYFPQDFNLNIWDFELLQLNTDLYLPDLIASLLIEVFSEVDLEIV